MLLYLFANSPRTFGICSQPRAELNEREAALTQRAAEVDAAVADVARRRVAEDREMAAQREAVCGC